MDSKLPRVSRLRPPSSVNATPCQQKPATQAVKRSCSPEEAPSSKRQRFSGGENKPPASVPRPQKLKPSLSSSSLNTTTGSLKLGTSRSGSNIRSGAITKTSSIKPPAVKPQKPVTIKHAVGASASLPPNTGNSSAANAKTKRPPWDLKGRLQDMEEKLRHQEAEKGDFMHKMRQWQEQQAQLEQQNSQLSGTVQQKEQSYSSVVHDNSQLKSKLRETEEDLYNIRKQLERDTENFEFTKASLRRQKEALEGELAGLQQEVSGLKTSVAQLTASQAGIKSELEATKVALEQATRTISERDGEIGGHKSTIQKHEATIQEYMGKFREHETLRRKLHNTILELKGNIRVFCRVRPLIGEELYGNDGEIHFMSFPDEERRVIELDKVGEVSLSESTIGAHRKANGRQEFTFDRVFAPDTTQAQVFEEISQLVQSALDGYNVCIFAYGQTGSGKTYTMEGPSVENVESMGMISRAVLQIFSSTRELEDKGWQYEFEASFLEIYNESIRDLLGNHSGDVKHDIKVTNGSEVMVTNLTTQAITSEAQITTLLKTASKNRAVGETQCNERSSRSHSVFRLKITGANEITGESCKATLSLVDLAGSERLKESGATGQRLKETQNINSSLSHLGKVIMDLGKKESHIGYRNSKLTFLLQNSLGGNSKTLMFVNVSPREESFSETISSLRFATMVNQCNIGTATKRIK
ncbi:carboxy-terminal kinesin 2-like [Dreissena polymorpha]|uniref:carboxy-terminal kinesin 2-like n=1 Tax=Dreissena polymorpha TaxID=45954 RepID=UPI0022651C6C|nr:carboxy-terminal kinesin 2-like [Dreissena polymorpha]